MRSGKVSGSCSTCGIRLVTFVVNPVLSHTRGNHWIMITTSWTYHWSFDTDILTLLTRLWWRISIWVTHRMSY